MVDDDTVHRFMLCSMLHEWDMTTSEAEDGMKAVEAIEGRTFDAVLMDVRMARMDGMEALKRIHAFNPAVPVIIMTAFSSVDDAVEAMKIGAHDYLTKPLDFERLRLSLERAMEHRQVEVARLFLQNTDHQPGFRVDIIGTAPVMRELLEMAAVVAPTDATVLITGESGTGKELIATALHDNSARAHAALVQVNCAAVVETLLESELFGHERGSFTGADRRREGKFVQADGGTLFLDEVGEMSPTMQAKLLRVLQEHELQRVGGQQTIAVDVRIIAATNRDLEEDVRQGRFREDLYYRLNVVTLHMPPLRDRKEDIPLLAEFFADRYATKNRRKFAGFTPGCMELLLRYPWPGNVRELENAMERGIILMRGEYLDEEGLPLVIQKTRQEAGRSADMVPASLAEAEQQVISRVLAACGGNKSEAARRLNITRKTLLKKISRYGLERS